MKLYYSAGSCSTSCHIVLEESGLKYEAIAMDWDKPEDAAAVDRMNPLGTLPVMLTDEGKQLDQNIAIQLHIAGKAPERRLFPVAGSLEYAEALNLLSFVATDLHKSIGGLFGLTGMTQDKNAQGEVRNYMVGRANDCLRYLDSKLAGRDYLMGGTFTVADAYAFVVTGWTQWVDIPLAPYKNVQAYRARVAARPAVAKVLKEEGLA